MMAKCQYVQKNMTGPCAFRNKPSTCIPKEAQANHLSGLSKIKLKKFDQAVEDFTTYENKLPGNPDTIFYQRVCL